MKKFFSCLLLCTLLCALPAHAAYSDVPEWEWYQPYVTELSAQGVISGYEDGTFRPDGTVTWGEALKLILLAAGQDSQPATDVHWAGGYLNLALQWGILPVGPHYDLDAPITRQQVAQIAARALGLRAVMAHNPFADCSDPEVLALCEAGIVEGMEHESLPILGVQFHPERITGKLARIDTVDGAAIFHPFLSFFR